MELKALGVTPQKERQFAKKGIATGEELIRFLPRKYRDFTRETGILPEDETSVLRVRAESMKAGYGRINTLKVRCALPGGGELTVTWFNQNFLRERLRPLMGQELWVAGKVRCHPRAKTFELLAPELFEADEAKARRIWPVYSKIPGMSADYLTEKVRLAIERGALPDEFLPPEKLNELGMPPLGEALRLLHCPETMEDVRRGRERLIFDDLLWFARHLERSRIEAAAQSPFPFRKRELSDAVRASLPYELTEDQAGTVDTLLEKAAAGQRLGALIQGDVGCGKSIVAFLLMAAAAENGYQAVLMAPTQVLARQHASELGALLAPFGVETVLLDSGMKAAERRAALQKIASGEAKCVVGTHAVLGKDVAWHSLALTVADEEHRFGAQQRSDLSARAGGVHTVTMSATPIPRSLSRVIYGDGVELCTIRSLPAGRKPIRTGIAVSRERIYRFLLSQIRQGRQAYVVCPAIDGGEEGGGQKSVREISAEYSRDLGPYGVRIATLTGRDSRADTEATIESFRAGETDILIATTVIEVGVNVPNASVMVITGAERFGLSSLHQLRGRVGRGPYQSVCVLESDSLTDRARERLEILCSTTDGFAIAEADLRLRGPGDLIGTRQSGDSRYLALMLDRPELFQAARETAREMAENPISLPHQGAGK